MSPESETGAGRVTQMLKEISEQERQAFTQLTWEGSVTDYLARVSAEPWIIRNAWQRLYDMIISYGRTEGSDGRRKTLRHHFFDDLRHQGDDAVFGLDVPLEKLVSLLKAAAMSYGPESRILLLHGPVGSSKSTIVRLLKKGIEDYSSTPEGAIFSFRWIQLGDVLEKTDGDEMACPMREEPLHLLPRAMRDKLVAELNAGFKGGYKLAVEGDLCPACRFVQARLMQRYGGDMNRVLGHVRVSRFLLNERDRIGIGTFQPKDEKNQDATELTGDINYRKIAIYGSDSDPRAFNFDGEFCVANRGLVEFVEILKLDVAFLYDLLGASQEHRIKPKKFPQMAVDEVIIGHTNEPEYRRLQSNEYMEAMRDRTLKVDVPYITRLADEIKIYARDFNPAKITGKHIAPHTIEMASLWAVLTRLEEPKRPDLTLLQKVKLYDGRMIPGFTEDTVRELRKEARREGMDGISPRYIQDRLSAALVAEHSDRCVNPFMVFNELESGLKHHSMITSEEARKRYGEMLSVVKEEYQEILKNEVRRAISADEEAIAALFANYLDNVKAFTQQEKVRNKFTGQMEEPDERLLRAVEEKAQIPEARKDDFRREIMNYIGALALEGKKFDWKTDERLRKALELKLFEDQKDSIKLSTLMTDVVDKKTQEQIEIVKSRLMRSYGYCEVCSKDVLDYIASIFARGDAKEN